MRSRTKRPTPISNPLHRLARTAGVALLLILSAAPGFAQGTAFTYQGQLQQDGSPAQGPYDLLFRLFDSQTDGSQLGSSTCADGIPVSAGTFTVTLDFGQQFAAPTTRYLEISVRAHSGTGCGDPTGFVPLNPRQPITPTPVALHAQSAFALDAADGSPQNAVIVDADGKVGIGTTVPQAKVHIAGSSEGVRVEGSAIGASNTAYITFADAGGTLIGYVGDGSTGDNAIYLSSYNGDVHLYTLFGAALTAKSNGNVGIGTTTPNAKLDVRGDIRLGSTGQYYAAKSNRNDHMLRGTVNTNGTIGSGTGFSVSHTAGSGIYVINWSTPWATAPTLVASSIAVARKAHVIQSQTTFTTVGSSNETNTPMDGGFTFIAMGE
ncbi:MAG: hypothetical protein KC729_02940 [Candidatus Eisenbacteria bacterium]|uniref:Uncharacterized protein n=1 Tax=Eiseniibacteriota bacterium TaxID=2212470 RepID=A0A956RNE1_UNCEI|nr:hypothetical protein [Candidatus Eisenbacteria bacterium]